MNTPFTKPSDAIVPPDAESPDAEHEEIDEFLENLSPDDLKYVQSEIAKMIDTGDESKDDMSSDMPSDDEEVKM